MTGDDMPPTSAAQTTFSPVAGSHDSGRPVSRLTPFCSGPRHWYQPGRRAVWGDFLGSKDGPGWAGAVLASPGPGVTVLAAPDPSATGTTGAALGGGGDAGGAGLD